MNFKYGDYSITPYRRLFGIMHWYLVKSDKKPPFDVYVYLGEDKVKELHFFRSRKGGDIIHRTLKEMALKPDFKPLVHDLKLIEHAIELSKRPEKD